MIVSTHVPQKSRHSMDFEMLYGGVYGTRHGSTYNLNDEVGGQYMTDITETSMEIYMSRSFIA